MSGGSRDIELRAARSGILVIDSAAVSGRSVSLVHASVAVQRFPLYSGASGAAKAAFGCVAVIGVFGGLFVTFFALMLSVAVSHASAALGVVALIVSVLVGLALAVSGVLPFGMLLRRAAWLEATTLAVRGPFRTRRCDLATARLMIQSTPEYQGVGNGMSVPTGRHIPLLCAQDPVGGPWVRLVLVDPATKSLYEPGKLHALGAAITRGLRPEQDELWAAQIAHGLQAMANDPFANLR